MLLKNIHNIINAIIYHTFLILNVNLDNHINCIHNIINSYIYSCLYGKSFDSNL